MTEIKIAQRLLPFSHEIGTVFLLPQTTYSIQVFPTRFYLVELEKRSEPVWVSFDWAGPVREFTAQVDLERGGLTVFGWAKEGYVRYRIFLREKGLWLEMDKAPKGGVQVSSSLFPARKMEKQEILNLVSSVVSSEGPLHKERLSLGNHKAQDMSGMRERLDAKELFPHWLKLAQELPFTIVAHKREGNYTLLDVCHQIVKEGKKQEILSALSTFFLSSFSGSFVPRLVDTEYQGLLSVESVSESLPLIPLLKESAECIRSLFYREVQPGEISLLSCLPPELHCGRMVDIKTSTGQTVHFEWTKKSLRKVILESSCSMELKLCLPKGISSCRIKSKTDNLKKIEVPKGAPVTLSLESGKRVTLDRFEG